MIVQRPASGVIVGDRILIGFLNDDSEHHAHKVLAVDTKRLDVGDGSTPYRLIVTQLRDEAPSIRYWKPDWNLSLWIKTPKCRFCDDRLDSPVTHRVADIPVCTAHAVDSVRDGLSATALD